MHYLLRTAVTIKSVLHGYNCEKAFDILLTFCNFLLFYGDIEVIYNVLEMFLSCSSFQGLTVEIYCYAVRSLVLLAGVCFLKSSIDSNNHLTSLDCSRPDFWRSSMRLSELLLSSFHPNILVCHLFGADYFAKATLAIQNSILIASSLIQWPSCACP